MWDWFPAELTDEQKADLEQRRLRSEDMFNRFKRMIAEDLNPDELQVLFATYDAILAAPQLANWYRGMVQGAVIARDLRLGETSEMSEDPRNFTA